MDAAFEFVETGTWRVRSRSSGKKYWIEIGPDKVRCDCLDYQIRRERTGTHCKHIHALLLELGLEVVRQIQQSQREGREGAEP